MLHVICVCLIPTEHVQPGLLFLLSNHSQSGLVSYERRYLSLQEDSLGAES